jgi:hypothetical protein
MDAIVKYLVINALMGSATGLIFGLAMLATDTMGMRSLVSATEDVVIAATI